MKTEAVRCDRCFDKALLDDKGNPPAGWGRITALTRVKPWCNTGLMDLCPSCFVMLYKVVRPGVT